MFQSENAGIVAIAPDDFVSVTADRHHSYRGERYEFIGFENAKGIGQFVAFVAASGARTTIAQMLPSINAAMSVTPLDPQVVGTVFPYAHQR